MLSTFCGTMVLLAASPKVPEYTILRTGTPIVIDGRLDEASWKEAPSVGDFKFAWWKKGAKEQTVAKVLWDDKNLYLSYVCDDAHISAVNTEHDSPVYRDDCVEFFTSPDPRRVQTYFNLEMNANGAHLDQFHPQGAQSGAKKEWDSKGVKIKVQIDGTINNDKDTDRRWILEAAVPFENYKKVARNIPPKNGDVWRFNLNRCGGKTNEQYSQWSPSRKGRPSFHVPIDFGKGTFSTRSVPAKAK